MFRIGDKVRCIDTKHYEDDNFIFLNKEYEVINVDGRSDEYALMTVRNSEGSNCRLWKSRFELVSASKTEKDELQTLIDDANKGLIALYKLKPRIDEVKAMNMLENIEQTPAVLSGETFTIVAKEYGEQRWKLVKTSKNTLQPFMLGKYEVSQTKEGGIKIGCQVHELAKAKNLLKSFLAGGMSSHKGFVLTRTGIIHDGEELKWADAETLYEKIKDLP
jgi:hypothetical protein